MKQELSAKIKDKQARIAVVGLGYVGLPIALEFVKKGFLTYGLDNNEQRVKHLKEGSSYITDISSEEVAAALKSGKFLPTVKQAVLKDTDVVIVCVPTPLRKRKIPNISYIIKASRTILKYLHPGQLIILESTTYPGTTRDVVMSILEKKGLKEGRDFFLSFSPERIDPANAEWSFANISKVVGGVSPEATELTRELYAQVIENVVPVSSAETAEVVKLLENTFRIVNIGLINEFAMLCNKLKIDVWEVVEAARTKPFGFMPFYPGPGLGGHCLDGKESIVIKNGAGIEVSTIGALIEKFSKDLSVAKKRLNAVEYLKPLAHYRMLTFDVNTNKAVFKPISMLSKRKTDEDLFKITTNDNRKVTVTGAHPMFVFLDNELKIKFAQDLEVGDKIPFASEMDYQALKTDNADLKLDLIELLKDRNEFVSRIRVRMSDAPWSIFKKDIYKIKFENKYYHDYVRNNYLPLKYFLYAEENKILDIRHERLMLCSGRGPSLNQVPAVISINRDFCRLIGYYLSEGCITHDKSTRIRFAFNSEEKECVEDLCGILKNMCLSYSTHKLKQWKTLHIKVSSKVFGFLLEEILKCGTNSYTMQIPPLFLTLPGVLKWELLTGLLRGDGGVDFKTGKRAYMKNGRHYNHFYNSAGVNYFTSSKKLFRQVVFLLHEFGLVPTFKKREGLLYLFGYNQILKLRGVFLDNKKIKIERYLTNNRKIISNRGFTKYKGFAVSPVKDIERIKGDYVYSAEVEDTHTIVTSYNTIVHNCIPADPLYLSWKARKVGFRTRMIDLAAKTNLFMPHYVVHRIEALLKEKSRDIAKAKILLLGVTYKRDVKDLRESPALDIIELLQKKESAVTYSDPYIPYLKINDIHLKNREINEDNLKQNDLLVLVTDHQSFDYGAIARQGSLILDTRNAFGAKGITAGHIIKL